MSGKRFRILCFGAGGIGTYVGGSLSLANHEVVFIERPESIAYLTREGLLLEIGGVVKRYQPLLSASIGEALDVGTFDLGIIAVKSYDLDHLIGQMEPFQSQLPPILCLQNGVENEPRLEKLLGKGRVIAGTVTSAVGRKDVGSIVLEKERGIGISSTHPLSQEICTAMKESGINCQLFSNPLSMKWSKLLTNLQANATSAILNWTPLQVFSDHRIFKVEMVQVKEALDVMKTLDIPVINLPGTPVRLLAWAVSLPQNIGQPLIKQGLGHGRGEKMPSFHIDLHGGRGQSEVEYLNGAVVQHGRDVGVSTPINETLTKLLLKLTNKEIELFYFDNQPERLLDYLDQ